MEQYKYMDELEKREKATDPRDHILYLGTCELTTKEGVTYFEYSVNPDKRCTRAVGLLDFPPIRYSGLFGPDWDEKLPLPFPNTNGLNFKEAEEAGKRFDLQTMIQQYRRFFSDLIWREAGSNLFCPRVFWKRSNFWLNSIDTPKAAPTIKKVLTILGSAVQENKHPILQFEDWETYRKYMVKADERGYCFLDIDPNFVPGGEEDFYEAQKRLRIGNLYGDMLQNLCPFPSKINFHHYYAEIKLGYRVKGLGREEIVRKLAENGGITLVDFSEPVHPSAFYEEKLKLALRNGFTDDEKARLWRFFRNNYPESEVSLLYNLKDGTVTEEMYRVFRQVRGLDTPEWQKKLWEVVFEEMNFAPYWRFLGERERARQAIEFKGYF